MQNFTSKDQLLAAAMVEWLGQLEEEVGRRPPRGDTPAERVVDVARRASRTLGRTPRLLARLSCRPLPGMMRPTASEHDAGGDRPGGLS
jgi:hypothetical protein